MLIISRGKMSIYQEHYVLLKVKEYPCILLLCELNGCEFKVQVRIDLMDHVPGPVPTLFGLNTALPEPSISTRSCKFGRWLPGMQVFNSRGPKVFLR